MDMPITIMKDASPEIWIAHPGAASEMLGNLESRFLLATMLPDLAPASSPFVINSFSRGTGLMSTQRTLTGDVIQTVPDGGWSFIVYGVSGTNWPAGGAGGIYAAEEAAAGGVQGDAFSYVDPGSETFFPPEEINAINKFRDGLEMDATVLKGLDTYMPGYLLGDEVPEGIGIEGTVFYFTVVLKPGVTATYDDLPDDWGSPPYGDWKGPATIFSLVYENDQWRTPEVFKNAAELFLPKHQGDNPANPLTVIDGLSVMDDAASAEVLLSTTDTDDNLEKQLWVVGAWEYQGVSEPYGGPLRTSSGALYATDKLKIPPQKGIRSICCDDPQAIDGLSPRHIQRITRIAFEQPRSSGSELVDTAAQRVRGNPRDRFRFILQGFISPGDRFAQLVMLLGSGPGTRGGGPLVVGTVTRRPPRIVTNNAGRTGDRKVLTLSVPKLAIGGLVTFQWRIIGTTGIVGTSREFSFYID